MVKIGIRWWEWPAAILVFAVLVGFHTWKWLDTKLRREGV